MLMLGTMYQGARADPSFGFPYIPLWAEDMVGNETPIIAAIKLHVFKVFIRTLFSKGFKAGRSNKWPVKLQGG